MNQVKVILSFSSEQVRPLQELAKRECLPVATLTKQIILKYLTAQQAKEN